MTASLSQILAIVPLAQEDLEPADDLGTVLDNVRFWIMGILVGLATVFATIGGVRRVAAGGDPGEIEASNRCFRSAAFGYVLAALAPLVVTILGGIVSE